MGYYTYVYIISLLISFFGGWLVWRQQRNISGIYFFLFIVFLSLWFIFYYLFFAGIFSVPILLMLSRASFGIGILAVYSLLFFLVYFGDNSSKLNLKNFYIPVSLFFGILCFYIFTDLIVDELEYSPTEGVYREVTGALIYLHTMGHITFLVLFSIYSYHKLKDQDSLNKIRLQNILLSAFILLASLIFLQLILPFFGIWILEKEIVFLFSLFVISVSLTVRRYYFSHFGYGIGKFICSLVSLIISIFATYGLRYVFLHMTNSSLGYWIDNADSSIFDIVVTLLIYIPLNSSLMRIFIGNQNSTNLTTQLDKLKKTISVITNVATLSTTISDEFYKIFTSRFAIISLYDMDGRAFSELRNFFKDKTEKHKVFINDIVFIDRYKSKFDSQKLIKQLPKGSFLIFPLYNTSGRDIGFFILGAKRFGDFYTLEEIDMIKEFAFFLEIHLKYIRTYTAMEDLSTNLDKKVDEKTIEYNDLINKQKEFISVISHEIKSPIASAIFQSDSIIDDLSANVISPDMLKDELRVLNDQLVRTGGLLSKLFSVQYYDTHKVNLFREQVEFPHFLEHELELFAHIHNHITFTSNIDPDIGFVEIDKIQFQQVLNNLLDNAVKFIDKNEDPSIAVSAFKEGKKLTVIIEDNGKGFQGIEIKDLFDKYTTGKKGTVGLGMGLYLCKKIISMHKGTIVAQNSEKYGGAKFVITIPVK